MGRLGRKHGLLYSGSAHTFHLSGLHVQPTSYVGRRSHLTSPKSRPKRPSSGLKRAILPHCGPPQHTLYPAKGPVLPRGPGRSPGRKFWPLQRHFNAENHVPMTYSTLLESSRRDLRDSGHTRGCEMGQKDGPGRAGTGRAGARARAAAHAGRAGGARAGRTLGTRAGRA